MKILLRRFSGKLRTILLGALGLGVLAVLCFQLFYSDPIVAAAWQGGGDWHNPNPNSTHQFLTKKAMETMEGMYPGFFQKDTSKNEYFTVLYSDWPDDQEKGTMLLGIQAKNEGHFYNFWTKTNLSGETTNTAKSNFIKYYQSAVSEYRAGRRTQAFQELGKAMHYLQDLGCTPHIVDTPFEDWVFYIGGFPVAMGLRHKAYENFVLSQKETIIANNPYPVLFANYINNSLDVIAETMAASSAQFINHYNANTIQNDINIANNTLPMTLAMVTGVLHRFVVEVRACGVCFSYTWSNTSATHHTCTTCGTASAHHWDIGSTQHSCTDCGRAANHSFYYTYTATHHSGSCACGVVVDELHTFAYAQSLPLDLTYHIKRCTKCTYLVYEGHDRVFFMGRYSCSKCGLISTIIGGVTGPHGYIPREEES